MPTIMNLLINVSYLKPNGSNWAIFATHFQVMIKATCLWGYLEGTKPCFRPEDADKPMDTEINMVKKWEPEDMVVMPFKEVG